MTSPPSQVAEIAGGLAREPSDATKRMARILGCDWVPNPYANALRAHLEREQGND